MLTHFRLPRNVLGFELYPVIPANTTVLLIVQPVLLVSIRIFILITYCYNKMFAC